MLEHVQIVEINMIFNMILEHKPWASLAKNEKVKTYIVLCDLLMNIHVTQSKTKFSTFSDDSTVSSCMLIL